MQWISEEEKFLFVSFFKENYKEYLIGDFSGNLEKEKFNRMQTINIAHGVSNGNKHSSGK